MSEELKTLKDFGEDWSDGIHKGRVYEIDELRAEAIKWIKSFMPEKETNYLVISFIKHFFNITEEDLVEEKSTQEEYEQGEWEDYA